MADRVITEADLSVDWEVAPNFKLYPGNKNQRLQRDFAAFEQQQLRARSSDTMHSVELIYPSHMSKAMRNSQSEYELVWPPRHASRRYEPVPLVDHRTIIVHTGWEDPEETRYLSYQYARQFWLSGDTDPFTLRRQAGTTTPTARQNMNTFIAYMAWAMNRAGSTTLKIVTFKKTSLKYPSENEEGQIAQLGDWDKHTAYIRFEIHTIFRTPSGGESDLEFVIPFTTNFESFYNLPQNLPRPVWWYGVVDLLHRITDRAHRHVAARAKEINLGDFDDSEIAWKRPRVPDITNVIHSVLPLVNVDTLGDGHEACWICANDFDTDLYRPFRLRCTHVICEVCLLGISRTISSRNAICPFCRQPIFTSNEVDTLVATTLCLQGDGLFHNDPRYTPWQNFERSCADLDLEKAENIHTPFAEPYQLRIKACWDLLTRHRDDQASITTSLYQQTQHYEELDWVKTAVHAYLDRQVRMGHAKPDPATLYPHLLRAIWREVEGKMRAGSIQHQMDGVGPDAYGRPRPRYFLRAGIEVFVERTLSRAINMTILRRCEDAAHWEEQEHYASSSRAKQYGFHAHGDRLFYCSEVAMRRAIRNGGTMVAQRREKKVVDTAKVTKNAKRNYESLQASRRRQAATTGQVAAAGPSALPRGL